MSFTAVGAPGSASRLGRYTLLFRFAAGGMAEVYVGRMSGEGGFEKPVAIKRMLPALAEEPRCVDMFLDEARIAAMISSPHVVPTLDVGRDEEGAPYIVMELVTGLALSQIIRTHMDSKMPAPLGMMTEILAQTAQGLDDAHTARRPTGEPLAIVHRDVSPQNILVGLDGRARLTDFGVARALRRITQTGTGEVKGKLSYFSPEQAKNQILDQRSDIFALGVVAWEALAGRRLFQRDDPMSTLRAILEAPIPLLSEVRKDVPEALASTVAIALARDPDERYESAAAFSHALRAARLTFPARAALGGWIESVGGDKLKTFRGRVASAFGGASTMATSEELLLASALPDSAIELEVEPSTSAVRTMMRTPTPAPVPAPVAAPVPTEAAPPTSSSRGIVIGIAIGAAVALVLVAGLLSYVLGGAPEQPVATSLSPQPTSTLTAPPAPATVMPAPEPTVVEAPSEQVDLAVEPPAARERPATRPRATTTTATTPATTTTPPTTPEPPPRVTAPPPETTTAPPPTTGPRRRLLGVGQFERETTTPH